jgi:DNA-directed RNA polymerase subunit alpha
MAILDFIKPDKVIMVNSTDTEGHFEFRPLEPGYGITVGNAIRRVLLSSLEGYAITAVKIEGVEHEFSTIKGVTEDMTEVILNLKQVRFKRQIVTTEHERVVVVVSGKSQFTAGDIGKFTSSFQVLNPDHVICNMEPNVKLKIEVIISKGRGYVPAEENKPGSSAMGFVAIDAIYTPIKNVKYSIENYRVEQKTDYEKLIVHITTDGSVHPKDSLKEAAKILIHHFMLFSDEKITLDSEERSATEEFDETSLSVRALNCLKAADVETLADLVSYNKNDLLKFRNFGKKSLTELEDLVHAKGLHFGMNLAKYKLDKE